MYYKFIKHNDNDYYYYLHHLILTRNPQKNTNTKTVSENVQKGETQTFFL